MALDRRRVGERLQASLAGLQELRLLRERHREVVRRLLEAGQPGQGSPGQGSPGQGSPGQPPAATTGDRQQPRLPGPSEADGNVSPNPDHQEATLSPGSSEPQAAFGQRSAPPDPDSLCPPAGPSCLGEDPSQARRSAVEVGSGAPLSGKAPVPGRAVTVQGVPGEQALEPPGGSGELKRMESGTQLHEGPLDNLESDSRPSSGFYDVTDSASCSLSNSCTSVYSECPSGSRWSMQSLSQLPRSNSHWNRPRSTDDSAVWLLDLRSQRLLLAGPGTPTAEGYGATATGRSKATQRPVSTGDLISFRRYPGLDPAGRPISCCCGDWGPRGAPDAKYQCDLVSRNGTEVYHYPSPLHAVALQSPLFTAPPTRGCPPRGEEGPGPAGVSEPAPAPQAILAPSRGRLDKYISGLVLRFRCRPPPAKAELASHAKSLSLSSVYSQGSSTAGAAPLVSPAGGWKLRRRISTCCPAGERARSPDRHPSDGGSEASSPSPLEMGLLAAFPGPEAFPCPLPWPEAPLYRGKHLHRELVRCPPADEGAAGGRASGSRSRSEMNLDSAGCQRPEALSPCVLEGRPSPTKRRQRKWTSVLEIPGPSSSSSRCRPRKPGLLGQAQAFLSRRHRAFSSESPPSAPLEASREDLWACHCRGDAGPCRGAETLPRPAVATETRFHRSKSFKELRKKVQLSIRPWSLKVNNPSK